MIRRVAVCAAIAVLATACSGDDDATPGPAPSTTATDAGSAADDTTEITEATQGTDDSGGDTDSASTQPPTSTSSTTDNLDLTTSSVPATSPTTTTDPAAGDVDPSVIDAVVASWRAFNEAKLDPTNDAKLAALGDTTGGDLLQNSIDVVARYRAENKRSVTNPDVPAAIVVYADTLVVDDVAGTAQVDYCRIGSNILVEVGGNADGTDLVLDDTVNTYIERSSLVFEGDHWIETGGVELEFLEGATACPERG